MESLPVYESFIRTMAQAVIYLLLMCIGFFVSAIGIIIAGIFLYRKGKEEENHTKVNIGKALIVIGVIFMAAIFVPLA